MLQTPPIGGAALLSLALYLPVGIYDALWSRYLTDRGASTTFIGISLSLYAVPVILLAPWGGRVSDRFGAVRASSDRVSSFIIPMTVLYGMVPWPVLIAAMAVCEGIPQAVATPGVQAAMVNACRSRRAGRGPGPRGSHELTGAARRGAGRTARLRGLRLGRRVHRHLGGHGRGVRRRRALQPSGCAASGDGVVATDVDDPDQPDPDVPLPLGT